MSVRLLLIDNEWAVRVDEVLPFIADTARRHGLVCFDPQQEQLI